MQPKGQMGTRLATVICAEHLQSTAMRKVLEGDSLRIPTLLLCQLGRAKGAGQFGSPWLHKQQPRELEKAASQSGSIPARRLLRF